MNPLQGAAKLARVQFRRLLLGSVSDRRRLERHAWSSDSAKVGGGRRSSTRRRSPTHKSGGRGGSIRVEEEQVMDREEDENGPLWMLLLLLQLLVLSFGGRWHLCLRYHRHPKWAASTIESWPICNSHIMLDSIKFIVTDRGLRLGTSQNFLQPSAIPFAGTTTSHGRLMLLLLATVDSHPANIFFASLPLLFPFPDGINNS